MKKLLLLPLILIALIPPMVLNIPMVSERMFTWVILVSAFLGLYTIFLNINIWVKIITVYLLCSCFFSTAIYYSFAAYIIFVLCLYYYILFLKFTEWYLVKRALLIVLLLNGILLFMQIIGNDTLLNFGLKDNKCLGIIGNFMSLKSFLFILVAFLISFIKIDIVKLKKWIPLFLTILLIMVSIYIADHKICFYFSGIRGAVWIKTIVLTSYTGITTLFGWGMSTFSITFPQIQESTKWVGPSTWWLLEGKWLQCHNDFLQILFETGFIGFTLVLLYTVDLFHRLRESRLYSLVIGLSLICADMMVHFPTRQTSTILLIVVFLAYCEYKIKESI